MKNLKNPPKNPCMFPWLSWKNLPPLYFQKTQKILIYSNSSMEKFQSFKKTLNVPMAQLENLPPFIFKKLKKFTCTSSNWTLIIVIKKKILVTISFWFNDDDGLIIQFNNKRGEDVNGAAWKKFFCCLKDKELVNNFFLKWIFELLMFLGFFWRKGRYKEN